MSAAAGTGPGPSSWRSTLLGITALVVLHLLLVGAGFGLRSVVLSTWQKGPLVDPAAPYAPENALVLFPIAACVALDVYLLVLALGFRRLGRRWWLPLVALVAGCAASEGALRAVSAQAMTTWFRPHPTLHWVVRENLRDYRHGTGDTPITTNRDGLREVIVPRKKPAGEYRILVLGDSSNFGQGVTGEEMGSAQLEDLLGPLFEDSARWERVVVLNAAVPGWTTFQGLERMRGVGALYEPDLVIAGFNNDPGPEVMTDAGRAGARSLVAPLNELLFRSEAYLIAREAVLAMIRRMSPAARATYAQRQAGAKPEYGDLGERQQQLVQRVPLPDFLENLRILQQMGEAEGWDTAWINMPINRKQAEYVERYVDWKYRAAVFSLAEEIDLPVIDVDGYLLRSREPDLFIEGHVFHPNARGHRRLAEIVAAGLLERGLLPGVDGTVEIGGPPPAATENQLRLGWSSLTPVHAHVGAVLREHPELAAKHGLDLVEKDYLSGGPQGEDVAEGRLDAFFSCEIPAIHMLDSRPDARIVASPGVLGRIAIVARRGTKLQDLSGRPVGVVPDSTPDMDWKRWSWGLNARTVPLETEQLESALREGRVDAIVGWDPWVEQWLQEAGGAWAVVEERPFHSVLAVGTGWALSTRSGRHPEGEPGEARAQRLASLVDEALRIAARDRPHYDAEVAEMSGWPVEVVKAVADRNALLGGGSIGSMAVDAEVRRGLDEAARALGRQGAGAFFGPELLQGRWPETEAPPPSGPPLGPPGPPPEGPPGPPPPGRGVVKERP